VIIRPSDVVTSMPQLHTEVTLKIKLKINEKCFFFNGHIFFNNTKNVLYNTVPFIIRSLLLIAKIRKGQVTTNSNLFIKIVLEILTTVIILI